jgi:hypothetical protein
MFISGFLVGFGCNLLGTSEAQASTLFNDLYEIGRVDQRRVCSGIA